MKTLSLGLSAFLIGLTPYAFAVISTISSSPNLPILDDNYNGSLASMACDSIDTTGLVPAGSIINDASVSVAIDHSWVGDLTIKLQTPDGSILGLMSRPGYSESADDGDECCGDLDDLSASFPRVFTDGGTRDAEYMGIDDLNPISYAGTYFPNPGSIATPPSNFSELVGESAEGTWTLCVGDSAFGDEGSLMSWILTLDAGIPDSDGDGVPNDADACPNTSAGETVNTEGCSISDLCPCKVISPSNGITHGHFVKCYAQTVTEFEREGLIFGPKGNLISEAAQVSNCGMSNSR
jgi:subtilisin-like proprotein convertase family protein